MKKFSYSLQKILDLRNFELDRAKAELGKVNALITEQNNMLILIAHSRADVVSQADSSLHDVSYLSNVQKYFSLLDQQKEVCLQKIAQLEIVADEKRKIVREAMQKVKALEKNRSTRYEEWKLENQHEEENVLDDIVTFKATFPSI